MVDAGKLRGLKPSTVVDLTARGIAKITRVGPVKPEEVERVVKRFGWRVMAEP